MGFANDTFTHDRYNGTNGTNILLPVALTFSKELELTAWITVTTIISFLAALNDIFLIIVIWPKRASPSSINFLIFHYVVVSFIVNFLCMPTLVLMIQLTKDGYTLPATICDWTHSSLNTFGGVLNWCDASLAVNRPIALIFPHDYKKVCTKTINSVLLVFPWVLCLGLNLLISLRVEGTFYLTSVGSCYTGTAVHGDAGFTKYFSVFMTYIPFGAAAVCACLILWKSNTMRRSRVGELDGNAFRRRLQRRLRLAKILLWAIFISAFCSVSAWASTYFTKFFHTEQVSRLWLRLLWATQFSVPPCFLFLLNSEYRGTLARILHHRVSPINNI